MSEACRWVSCLLPSVLFIIVAFVDFDLEFAAIAATFADAVSAPASATSTNATVDGGSSDAAPLNSDARFAVVPITLAPASSG